jgi:hypothetical protein
MRPKLSYFIDGERIRTRKKIILGEILPVRVPCCTLAHELAQLPEENHLIMGIGWEVDRMVIHVQHV